MLATLVAGALLQYLLRRYDLLRRVPVTLAAGAVGAVAFPLAWSELVSLLGDLPANGGAVLIGAFSGIAAGSIFWAIVAGGKGRSPAPPSALL